MVRIAALPVMQLGRFTRYDPKRKRRRWPTFTVPIDRRMQHTWIVGKTGVGKSTLLANMLIQDIASGRGCALFDPHGDLAQQVLSYVPPARRKDVIYFNPADRQFPIGFNILERVPIDRRPLVAASVVEAFYHLWKSSWGPQLEQILYNTVAALLDVPDGTLLGVKYMLTSPAYRRQVVGHIQDPEIRSYWRTDFAEHMPEREQRERTLSTLNKIGQLIADPMLRNIVGQPKTRFDFGAIMDEQKIFIANLSQGELSARKSSLLGSLLLAKFHTAALQRAGNRTPFHMVFDEFHNFGSASFLEMLSGIRKYGVSLTLAHQYLDQLTPELRAAVVGTVGTIVSFKIGATDAEALATEFDLEAKDFTGLRPYTAYVRSGGTTIELAMPPVAAKAYPSAQRRIVNRSRQLACRRDRTEQRIARFIARS